MKKFFLYIAILSMGICWGCSDWLDVKPSDRVSEENVFSTIAGFKTTLNGIYIELNQDDLYGHSLTVDFVEILAQRYAVNEQNELNYDLMNFKYESLYVEGKLQNIWQKAYNLIANANLLIKNCDVNRQVLPDNYYGICKGEALALRAMLHFDLFRLFGPLYGKDSLLLSIPYYKEFALEVEPKLTGVDFMNNVVDDLLAAEDALQVDPIITNGVKGDVQDPFLQYRNLRLNYYAVQVLLARAYLYKEEKANALVHARKAIEVQEKFFPWVDPMDFSATAAVPDRVFSSEIVFALQNRNRNNLFSTFFDAQNLKEQTLLAPENTALMYSVFGSSNYNADYRYLSSFGTSAELGGKNYAIFRKYEGSKDSLYNQMLPMLKISEAYLIAAETETDKALAATYINTLRNNRGLVSVPDAYINYYGAAYYADQEYPKEFCGEGQLFFYYKRKMKTTINRASGYGTRISIPLSKYVLPVPNAEIKYN